MCNKSISDINQRRHEESHQRTAVHTNTAIVYVAYFKSNKHDGASKEVASG